VAASEVSGSAARRIPSATLILRVWRETDSEQPFRARLVAVDGDGDTTELGVAADADAVLAAVRRWIEQSAAS
jgi:hypothetical protein